MYQSRQELLIKFASQWANTVLVVGIMWNFWNLVNWPNLTVLCKTEKNYLCYIRSWWELLMGEELTKKHSLPILCLCLKNYLRGTSLNLWITSTILVSLKLVRFQSRLLTNTSHASNKCLEFILIRLVLIIIKFLKETLTPNMQHHFRS